MKTDKLLLAGGIVAGAATGVLIGILLAPDKGEETRKKIFEKSQDQLDGLKDKLEGIVTAVCRKIESVKNDPASCCCGPDCSCRKQEARPATDEKQV